MTNTEQFFEEGQDAYRKGLSSYDCPYHIGGVGYVYWHKGWINAQKIHEHDSHKHNGDR